MRCFQKDDGRRLAIKPENGQVVAPVAGTAITVFPTGHAVGIRTKDNVDVLVHIGLDTVNLKGEGFKTLIQEGDEVRIGQPIVDFDQDVIEKKRIRNDDDGRFYGRIQTANQSESEASQGG